jgi:hypothetical protein
MRIENPAFRRQGSSFVDDSARLRKSSETARERLKDLRGKTALESDRNRFASSAESVGEPVGLESLTQRAIPLRKPY